jgi:DNA-binding IclR family transcriptional regulator
VRVSVELGGRYELHTSAPGKVLLAHDEQALAQQLARGLARRTARTIVDTDDLRGELLAARQQGYAVDQGEGADGLLCLAVPIFDHQARCVGTMGISVLSMNHSMRSLQQTLLPELMQAGQQVSAHLGYAPTPD